MDINSPNFKQASRQALQDETLQKALIKLKDGFAAGRTQAVHNLPEFDQLRDRAKELKDHTLQHLDTYLETFEKNVIAQGGHVHWAQNAEEANSIIINLCHQANAKYIAKSKSMLTEEINLNSALEGEGLSVVETDLGEYIIQIRHEHPTHIVAPAMHILKEQIADDFKRIHTQLKENRDLTQPESLLLEARNILRQKFLHADVGITGANCLIADSGTVMMVTNEGNGDLTQTLPDHHIVVAGLEKVVPTFDDAAIILRLLARSAIGQEITSYTSFTTGPKRTDDRDGPTHFHIVLVDNGRTDMLGSRYQDMLRCIRCGACMNHCPVYSAVGGKSYGWVYPGPMGAVITPNLTNNLKETHLLPEASTSCGRCEEVCPVRIPLPAMMRHLKEESFDKKITPKRTRLAIKLWALLASHPYLYHSVMSKAIACLYFFSRKKGYLKRAPMAKGWTQYRHLAGPSKKTFQQLWKEQKSKQDKGCVS